MDKPNVIENFYGVYLLYCKNPKYLGRTYIGYTVDPNRRIKQHNKGKQSGGARRTSKKGPWSMVMIIHGFPNDVAALRFEWAWQHPTFSRRLNKIPRKRSNEKVFNYCLRILSEMLRTGPWNKLPLTIRWLDNEFRQEFPIGKAPPIHMPIVEGTVISKKVSNENSDELSDIALTQEKPLFYCHICNEIIVNNRLRCLNNYCNLSAHLICLSKLFLQPDEYVPIEGKCPKCFGNFLWGDFIRKLKGCYKNTTIMLDSTIVNEDLSDSDND